MGRWRVCCAVDMGTAIQKKQVMQTCRLSLTFSRLPSHHGNWELSTRPWVVATSSVASMYLELGTVDSVRAGPTAVSVKEAEVFDCHRGSRSSGFIDFVFRRCTTITRPHYGDVLSHSEAEGVRPDDRAVQIQSCTEFNIKLSSSGRLVRETFWRKRQRVAIVCKASSRANFLAAALGTLLSQSCTKSTLIALWRRSLSSSLRRCLTLWWSCITPS